MQDGRISQTALKVAATLITLSGKRGWRERLPAGTTALTERLLLAAGAPGYNRLTLGLARRRWAVRLSALGERLQPGTFEGLGERKIFMNEQVLAAIEDGARQVLVIGAGFDTLCLRLAPEFPQVQFIEVDHPATAAAKHRGIERIGRPSNLHPIAADLARQSLVEVLAACRRWDKRLTSVAVAEGLLYYLDRETVHELMRELDACTGPGSRVAFSHLLDLDAHGLARVALAIGGEPWLSSSGAAELPDYLGTPWQLIASAGGHKRRDLEGFAVAAKPGG